MLRRIDRLSILLGCVSVLSFQAVWSAPVKQSGLLLDVDSDYFGPSTIQVSKDGIRIDSKKLGITIVSHAPDWSVVAFNERSKSYYEATLEEWKRRVASRTGGGKQNVRQDIKQTGKAKIKGQDVKIYRWTDVRTRYGKLRSTPTITDLYAMQSELVPKQAAAVIASASDLPPDFGLPMKITRILKAEPKPKVVLDTLKCSKGQIARSVFFQPKGFKRVSSEVALLMEGDDGEMDSLMSDFR